MEEGIVERYLHQLKNTNVASHVLLPFYVSVFELDYDEYSTPKNHAMFNKLTKMYGRNLVFYTILDMADMENIDHYNVYRLISAICKRKLNDILSSKPTTIVDLTKVVDKMDKKRVTKKDLGRLFDDE